MAEGFSDFVRRATGEHGPYPYQARLAEHGLPAMLRVETGAGKTLAAVLPWLWRLLEHPDAEVRAGTPRRLVYVLPLRSLVNQTVQDVGEWLTGLGLVESVELHLLMGGEGHGQWRLRPEQPAIVVCTQDMILSRLLMRGYAEQRPAWPIAFGLMNSGTQFVFDETQLMGPATVTSAQLQGLRDSLGTALPTATMWMSATLQPAEIATPDHEQPAGNRIVELGDDDRQGALEPRLTATKRVRRLDVGDDPKRYPAELASALLARHVPGTRTIAVLNTVGRATDLYRALRKRLGDDGPELLLLHSRYRPEDRSARTAQLKDQLTAPGQIVISTQVLEAGIDLTSKTMLVELAPWSSIVQRAGRCNRGGEYDDADLLWVSPPDGRAKAAPYDEADLAAAEDALIRLESRRVTSVMLREVVVEQGRPLYPVLRRQDLLELFDTMPDLSGSHIDVSRWIRDGDDTSLFVAWRAWQAKRPVDDEPFPGRAELCPAPIGDVRKLISGGRRMWLHDQVEGWRPARQGDLRPGIVLLTDAAGGGYDPDAGWSAASRAAVPPVTGGRATTDSADVDPSSFGRARWVTLVEHLSDVEREVREMAGELRLPGHLSDDQVEAAALAARWHDLGKCHPTYAEALAWSSRDDPPPHEGVWAKSPGDRISYGRPFRHELVSALMLLHPDCPLLTGTGEPDLIAYLAAAHHGKVRLSIRSIGDEANADPPRVLGVADGFVSDPVRVPGGVTVPSLRIGLSALSIGEDDGEPSWQARVLRLRDRPDLGPFRLAFLEALVRMADWRASADEERPAAVATEAAR